MKKSVLLILFVIMSSCFPKQPEAEKVSSFKPFNPNAVNFWEKAKSLSFGLNLSQVRTILKKNEISAEALQPYKVCYLFQDDAGNTVAAEFVVNQLSRWVINRYGCATFLID